MLFMQKFIKKIKFPKFSGIRCLMMPYIQGDIKSVPKQYSPYYNIIESTYIKYMDIGYLTIDESIAIKDTPHRGKRAKFGRAIHTEAGKRPGNIYAWGDDGLGWGESPAVILDANTKVLLANNLDDSCALWDTIHKDTSFDGDIGYDSNKYPYSNAVMMQAGDVYEIGILTPHESLPVKQTINRQFLRIVSSGVHGRELYFTKNPLM